MKIQKKKKLMKFWIFFIGISLIAIVFVAVFASQISPHRTQDPELIVPSVEEEEMIESNKQLIIQELGCRDNNAKNMSKVLFSLGAKQLIKIGIEKRYEHGDYAVRVEDETNEVYYLGLTAPDILLTVRKDSLQGEVLYSLFFDETI